MRPVAALTVSLCCGLLSLLSVSAQSTGDMARIEGGSFVPLYGNDTLLVEVEDYLIDVFPVTNAEFLEFTQAQPRWRRSNVPEIFADGNYLRHWASDTELAPGVRPDAPVTNVSWFAAKHYCASVEKRLPTMDEWEYAAMADEHVVDARQDSAFKRRILEWYERPTARLLPAVGSTFANYYGIWDLHGLVWEWVSDFNSVLMSGESRKDVGLDRNMFCAGSAIGSTDLMDYAAFMRYAFRGSLEANYTIGNLGFRCARSADDP